MSRIRFEWDIESDRVDRSDSEQPQARLRRRRNFMRLILLVALLLAAAGIVALALRQRMIDVQHQIAQLLQDTVKAEVAALRIGDLSSWLQFQSNTDDEWRSSQRGLFQHYEALKAEGAIDLTGSIVAVHIDETRARILVQENIKGLPYLRLWFYQRADHGWQHVAPDFSFWGADRQFEGAGVRVNYREVDELFARQLGDVLVDWRMRGCALLNCGELPTLLVDVLPDAPDAAAWADEESFHLQLRSPFLESARADLPFDGAYRLQVSKLIAKRMASEHAGLQAASYPNDAFFLFGSAINWLSQWLVGARPSPGLIQSLAQNYGEQQVAQLLALLEADDDMSKLLHVIPVAIESAELDWRDFAAWRLNTEADLITARAENAWLELYDSSLESVRRAAYQRFSLNAPLQIQSVLDQVIGQEDGEAPQLLVTAITTGGPEPQSETVIFNLRDAVWKRAS